APADLGGARRHHARRIAHPPAPPRPPASTESTGADSLVDARHLRHRGGTGRAHIVWISGRPRPLGRVSVYPGRDQVPRSPVATRRYAARVPCVLSVGYALFLQPVAARRARRAAG